METSETVFIGLGSNLGDSSHILREGWKLIGRHQGVSLDTISLPYFSAPVGMASNFWFTNAVGQLATDRSAPQILDLLLETEQILGRVRRPLQEGYQDRGVDLDLLYYGTLIQGDPYLTVPHPHLYERLFVLEPLMSIAPALIDPAAKESIQTLYHRLTDRIEGNIVENQQIKKSDWSDLSTR